MGSKAIKLKDVSGNAIYPCPYYPVGSIYISVNSTNPSTYFGGTWEQIQDRFLLCAGSTYKAGNTGGEATHTLTINEMPSHNHNTRKQASRQVDFQYGLDRGHFSGDDYASSYTIPVNMPNVGGGQAHNNMPPYLVVYVWKRTA